MDYSGATPDIVAGLKILRKRIEAAKIPPSKLDETINVATWNIREFGKKKREKAAIYYIAEILSQFDLIAIVELRENLSDLARVMDVLGSYWRVVFCDTLDDRGGNDERIGYLYDQRAVYFTGLAAEGDGPRTKNKSTGEYVPDFNWWRKPYLASFQAGAFDFVVITTHIQWGTDKGRTKELKEFAAWVAGLHAMDRCFDKDIIVMGDFNVPDLTGTMFKALTGTGLRIPKALKGTPGSNLGQAKHYDQILHLAPEEKFFANCGGVLDFYAGDHKPLFPGLTKDKFTYQLSDHLPLWIQIQTDRSEYKLDQIVNRQKK